MSVMSCEFVIEEKKKVFIEEYENYIEKLFDVTVSYPNGGSSHGKLWVTIEGEQENRNRAKDYIKALTDPEQKNQVNIPTSLLKQLGKHSTEHKRMEFDYGVVIEYPQANCAIIKGSDVAVTLATSKLEDLKITLAKQSSSKSASNENILKEFALKLGYEQEQITAVFDKLGPNVDRNTLLNELINLSKQKTKMTEERRATYSGYNRDMMGDRDMITSRSHLTPENHGIVARGCVARPKNTQTPFYPSNRNTMMARDQYSCSYQASNEYNQMYPDPRQEEQIFQDLLTNSLHKQFPKSNLRHIVIDGSNVAMSHGNNKVFSCKGIQICVNWFVQRGHKQITVFVPQWRKEAARPESMIKDQYILNELEEQGYLTFTPARRVNGRRIVCYDDRFVVRLADSTDGIIVSNDNFKDLSQENTKWKEVIERQLLMYSFVNDIFMPPDDPLGRHGPNLDEFLRQGTPAQRRICPYGRRCTFGPRCKYYHPEKEDKRVQVYQVLKDMFPSQDALIVSVMKKYPHEKDPHQLASRILDASS